MNQTGIHEDVLNEISRLAKVHHIQKVILFGSRARGDFHRSSDIDLAVSGGDVLQFSLDIDEKTPTLLTYDVVDLGKDLCPEFRESIQNEGMVLYEEV